MATVCIHLGATIVNMRQTTVPHLTEDHFKMTKPMNGEHEKCLTSVAQHIDYRTLIRRSRYEQIEAEVAKLKCRLAALEGQKQSKSEPMSKFIDTKEVHKPDQHQAESKNDRLNQALVNIEDDLHRILYILLQQYEVIHRKQHTKHSNVCSTDLQNSKDAATRKERSKLSRESRAISQPNLFSQTSVQQYSQELTVSAKPLCPQPKFERRQSSPRKQKGLDISNCHYHITKPDVHWILGTSSNPSFSMMARRQIQLASLKQHGSLCLKSTPNLAIDCAPEDRAQMISRIQTMINELQFEYDRWYRKLQFQQSVDDHSREDSAEISHLSSHLIHIMDQLVELHQLNKSFLC